MTQNPGPSSLHRRTFLIGLGGLGGALALGRRWLSGEQGGNIVAQEDPTEAAEWTPPDIPEPLPTQGGVQPTVVGAAPEAAEAAPEEATPLPADEAVVEDPGAPPQPAATPDATPEPDAPAEPTVTVTLTPELTFDPEEVTIQVGETVRWENAGRSPQTVTGDPARADDEGTVALPEGAEPWDSGVLNAGDSFEHTFEVAGEYVYVSMPQAEAGMVGRVIVEER